MEKKDFILILIVIIVISGGYYLYSNNIWPFVSDGGQASLPDEIASQVYVVSGVAKEVYDTVIVLQPSHPIAGNNSGELKAVINGDTSIFVYNYNGASPENIERIELSVKDIQVGDRLVITADENIAQKQNGIFLASSIAVYY